MHVLLVLRWRFPSLFCLRASSSAHVLLLASRLPAARPRCALRLQVGEASSSGQHVVQQSQAMQIFADACAGGTSAAPTSLRDPSASASSATLMECSAGTSSSRPGTMEEEDEAGSDRDEDADNMLLELVRSFAAVDDAAAVTTLHTHRESVCFGDEDFSLAFGGVGFIDDVTEKQAFAMINHSCGRFKQQQHDQLVVGGAEGWELPAAERADGG